MSFNHELLRRAVALKQARLGFGLRETGEAVGIPWPTVHQFLVKERVPDVATAVPLAEWVGLSFGALCSEEGHRPCPETAETLEVIDAALASDPALTLDEAKVVSALMRAAYVRSTQHG